MIDQLIDLSLFEIADTKSDLEQNEEREKRINKERKRRRIFSCDWIGKICLSVPEEIFLRQNDILVLHRTADQRIEEFLDRIRSSMENFHENLVRLLNETETTTSFVDEYRGIFNLLFV